jgi:hypothetical protein
MQPSWSQVHPVGRRSVPCEEASSTGNAQELLDRIAGNVHAPDRVRRTVCRRDLEHIYIRGFLIIASRVTPI